MIRTDVGRGRIRELERGTRIFDSHKLTHFVFHSSSIESFKLVKSMLVLVLHRISSNKFLVCSFSLFSLKWQLIFEFRGDFHLFLFTHHVRFSPSIESNLLIGSIIAEIISNVLQTVQQSTKELKICMSYLQSQILVNFTCN